LSEFLLDTNVVSELRKRQRADPQLVAWMNANLDAEFFLSVLVVGELRRGVESISRCDPPAAAVLMEWLDSTISDYADRILPITIGIAQRWAVLSVPDPLPVIDGLLAATALENNLTLVTRNIDDVARTGAEVLNPFRAT
jgi:predicted nucleic acid-binding protein